jgi:hypothetical protein
MKIVGTVRVIKVAEPNGLWEIDKGTITPEMAADIDARQNEILRLIHRQRFQRKHKEPPSTEPGEYVNYYLPHRPTYRMRGDEDNPYDNDAEDYPKFVVKNPIRGPATFDGREYLDSFMAVKSPEDGQKFLGRYGNPDIDTGNPYTSFRRICELQTIVRNAGATSINKWPPRGLPSWATPSRVAITHDPGKPPSFTFMTTKGVEACCAQVFFELLQGVGFATCKLRGCDRFFRTERRRDKEYCCIQHQHLAVVRRSREKKPRRSGSGKKTKQKRGGINVKG